MPEFKNETDLEFEDISTEQSRIYRFPNNEYIQINLPVKLHVSKSGGHRIFDEYGHCHYIPPKWIHLKWTTKKDKPHFVK